MSIRALEFKAKLPIKTKIVKRYDNNFFSLL